MSSPQLLYYKMGEKVTAFSSTRYGGCSQGNYRSFNVNRYCGDDEEHIARNMESLKALIGVGQVFMPHQVHGTEILQVRQAVPWGGMADQLEGVDALITDVTGICIGVSTADCIPVLLYDEVRHAAAAVHAGWRGTVKRIIHRAGEAMTAAYGTQPQQMVAQIGPGIHLDSFEVGDEVYEAFQKAGFKMEKISRKKEKWHIDLPECNRQQLIAVGLQPQNIRVSPVCTFQQADDYFSARRLGVNSGRIFSGIVIS